MLTLLEAAKGVRSGERSAVEIVERCVDAIHARDKRVNAFVYLDVPGALQAASVIDEKIEAGRDPGPLAGVPFGIKDLRDTCAGMPTKNGSLIARDAGLDERDSPHIARLKTAGAIPLGKVATAEFGLDGVTHTIAHGTTRNPWDLSRTAGGSSGGSSAAVAAGLVPFATGGDGLGSIRCPAGYTGLVGHKPSLGRIARANGFADTTCPGALTVTVTDTARYLDAAAGPDDRDRMTLPATDNMYELLVETLDVRGLRVVWSADLGFAPVEQEVVQCCELAADRLIEAAELVRVADTFECTNAYVAWNALTAVKLRAQFENQGFLPGRLDEISPGPRRFIEQYGYRKSAQLIEYENTVMQIEQELADFFQDADVLLTPTACCVPYAAEGPLPEVIAGLDASETNGEPYTVLASIGWNPSISVPAGLSADGLPIGLLINVRRHRDDIALRLARISEQVSPWPLRPPGW